MRPWSDQEWPPKYDAAKVEALLKEQGLTMRGTSNGRPDVDMPASDTRWLDVQRIVAAVHSGQIASVPRPPKTQKPEGRRSHHKGRA